jgi:hypothetical protein
MNISTTLSLVSGAIALASSMPVSAAPAALPLLPAEVPVVDMPAKVFQPASRIKGWVARDRSDLMKAHAWDLFAAAMTPLYDNAGDTVRLFDTWHSLDESVPAIGAPLTGFGSQPGRNPARARQRVAPLGVATQSVHGVGMASRNRTSLALSDAIVSDVKYNPAIGRFIESELIIPGADAAGRKIVAGYNLGRQVVRGQSSVVNFTDTRGVMLKPAFTIIKGKGPTVIARWEEAMQTVNPASVASFSLPHHASPVVGSERTWRKQAVVYPGQTSTWAAPATYYGRDGTVIPAPADLASLPKFNLSDFHYVRLTAAHVDSLRGGILKELMGPNLDNIEVGDYAVLTSMHIATREIDSWTWQTFWWQPLGGESLSANGASADLQDRMKKAGYKPLKHFRAGVGYSYVNSRGEDIIASNPYLEGSFGLPADLAAVFGASAQTDGVNVFLRDGFDQPLQSQGRTYVHAQPYGLRTNCVTCHKAAAYPTSSLGWLPQGTQGIYPDHGTLDDAADLLKDRVQTHFLWGVANKVSGREEDALAAGLTLP